MASVTCWVGLNGAWPACWHEGDALGLTPGHPALPGSPRRALQGKALFFGPVTGPLISHNPGPVRCIMLLMPPDAVHALIGLPVADWVNRHATIGEVLGADWQALSAAMLAEPDEAGWMPLLQDVLLPRWRAARPRAPLAAHRCHDWAQALALRAATSAPGRSLRQTGRRVRQWAGQPMRELQGMVRIEQVFFDMVAARAQAAVAWAAVAADSGYADQSQLCRATRRLTGFAPQALARRIASDETFWPDRVWM